MATEIEQSLTLTKVESPDLSAACMPITTTPASASSTNSTSSSANNVTPTKSGQCSISGNGQSSASRRPPRKSTLTQQQKNQKRQRATQDQLTTLELEFNKNPTPTAQVREKIAEEINMTERSVQIWFQNRRAKIKMLAKKSFETGEDLDSIPESMRNFLVMQAYESGKGLGGAAYLGRNGFLPYGGGNFLLGAEQTSQSKVLIHHLTCHTLSIGKWTRVGQNTMDLVIFYSPAECTMTYYINSEQAGYKIEYPFSYIKNIWLDGGDSGVVIELNQPPIFQMDQSATTNGFVVVGDFTEEQQASHCLIHHLAGNPKTLATQLAKLMTLDSFKNRHNPQYAMPFADPHALSVSAPVSPTARPSSQPNFAQPHMGMSQEHWGISHLHSASMRPQGHRRQRSRSVPGPIDFAMFQNQPMPSFYIQPPTDMGPPQHNPNIYAPVPQQPSGMPHGLRIDTQAGFGLDMRQYPLSATTASPSDFPPSPGFFPQGGDSGSMAASSYSTPYGNAFLSPMVGPETNMPTSVSPLPFNGPSEPSIGLYPGQDGSCAISDDGGSLNEMYSKHSLNMPMHTPSPGSFVQPSQTDLDMDQLVQFDAVDTSSLSPETLPHIQ
ncbi:Pyriculol/pyriculariol biosynthesis cluster transcription factor 1 [Cladobotryum mycophilum]|uniref:Pyriculol/pyriculariol biosynthesis cluster transcription factor 1 n=1 Tax=Cladobotryum mycophilum TaxID=491253 RepID=A0ABR0SP48_9HYPO